MNKSLLAILKTKCKDFGLNNKALEELTQIGGEGISDDASEEEIEKIADTLVPFAKAMQAEVTRKLQAGTSRRSKKNESEADEQPSGDEADENNDNGKAGEEVPAYFKKFMKEMREQNKALSKKISDYEEKERAEQRKASISDKAKELGIPAHLIKRFSIADDEDITEVLTEFKQSLVDNGLPTNESSPIKSSSDEEVKEDALSWAKKLPNN